MSSISTPTSDFASAKPIQENKILIIWSFTSWLVVMNTTMFNVALPTVLSELSINSSMASWIVSGYSIAFAISTLAFSRLSDFIPISKLLLIGIAILGVSSILGFFASHFYLLLAARILQAAGAGAVPGLVVVLIRRYVPITRRGKAMSFITSAVSLAFGLGPVVGGAITQYLGWKYLFGITGLVVLFIPFFRKWLPKEKVKRGHFDLLGAVLTALSVTGLLLFFSTFSYIILISTLVLSFILWKYLHKMEAPFIQPELLKNRQFLKLLFIGFTTFLTNFSTLFLLPIILTVVFKKEPAEVGLIIFPGAILGAIASQFIGRLIDRIGSVSLIITGQLLLFSGTIMLGLFSTVSPLSLLTIYIVFSIGFSTINSSISNEVTRILSIVEIGAGAGMTQLVQFFGGAFGVTLAGLMLTFQKGLLLELVYRNIFLSISFLIFCAMIMFYFYYRKVKFERMV